MFDNKEFPKQQAQRDKYVQGENFLTEKTEANACKAGYCRQKEMCIYLDKLEFVFFSFPFIEKYCWPFLLYCTFVAIPRPAASGLQTGTVEQTGQQNFSIKGKKKKTKSSLSK